VRLHGEGVEVDGVHEQIDAGANGEPQKQGARNVAPGLADLAGHVHRRVPAQVAEQHGREGQTEGREGHLRGAPDHRPQVREITIAEHRAEKAQGDQRRDLQAGSQVVGARTPAHADVVEGRDRQGQRDRHAELRVWAERDELGEARGEARRQGRDGAGVDHEEAEPAHQEARRRVIGLAEIDVVPPGVGVHGPELGVGQGAGQG
jgi:hypothetical protein